MYKDISEADLELMVRKAKFELMVRKHDLSFMYSDDSEVRRRGRESLNMIKQAVECLPEGVGEAIFNKHVDSTVSESYRKDFYLFFKK